MTTTPPMEINSRENSSHIYIYNQFFIKSNLVRYTKYLKKSAINVLILKYKSNPIKQI